MNKHFGSNFDDFLSELEILEHCVTVAEERVQLLHGLGDEWVKSCPLCGQILRKKDPEQPWECSCGWSTRDYGSSSVKKSNCT